MIDEKGQIAVDFLLGISLFLIALIFIVQFIPSLFLSGSAGESSLDYTAYRTAAILAEDTGWWGNSTSSGTAWEAHPDNVMRIGLAVDHEPESKLTNTPNLLSKDKIERFMMLNESDIIEKLGLYNNVDGAHFSYGYNISILQISQNNTPLILNNTPITLGEATPHDRETSKITRIVLVETGTIAYFDAEELPIDPNPPVKKSKTILNVTGPLSDDVKLYIDNFDITGTDPSFNKLVLDGTNLSENIDYTTYKIVNGTVLPLNSTGNFDNNSTVVFSLKSGLFNNFHTYQLEIEFKDVQFTNTASPFMDYTQELEVLCEPAYLTVEVWN
ncbi:MAG: hypothetical protein RBT65_08525 [Methanolobus sp.]|jgi:hypothetical protein|nr:hypothetical protein [Methanolobus sp.]